jgi:hypothetical protein
MHSGRGSQRGERLQLCVLTGLGCDEELAAATMRHAALLAKGVELLLAFDAQSGLQRTAPFDVTYRDGSAFYLGYSRAAAKLPHIAEFRDWLIGIAKSDPD